MREFILLLAAVVAAVAVNGEDHAQIEVREHLQGDQLNMAVCFWYLLKSDTCRVAYTKQVTLYKVPEIHGHVYLVGL